MLFLFITLGSFSNWSSGSVIYTNRYQASHCFRQVRLGRVLRTTVQVYSATFYALQYNYVFFNCCHSFGDFWHFFCWKFLCNIFIFIRVFNQFLFYYLYIFVLLLPYQWIKDSYIKLWKPVGNQYVYDRQRSGWQRAMLNAAFLWCRAYWSFQFAMAMASRHHSYSKLKQNLL